MKEQLSAVEKFHTVFKIGTVDEITLLSDEVSKLRFNLMEEENMEYLEACKAQDIVGVADALGDMLYILCGTILKHGLHNKIEEVFAEIQRSNMSKLDVNGEPIFREDGKILKGPNYTPPNIKDLIF